MSNLLGGIFEPKASDFESGFSWLYPIAKFLDNAIIPIIIIVAILGAIWIIWIGVQLAKAEDPGKAADQKKKLINVVIALVAVIVFIFLFTFIASSVPTWVKTATNPFDTK